MEEEEEDDLLPKEPLLDREEGPEPNPLPMLLDARRRLASRLRLSR